MGRVRDETFLENILSEFGKLEIQFQQSNIGRTGAQKKDRPICEPKNTEFFDKSPLGASIGISGYTDHTALLAGISHYVIKGYISSLFHHILPEDDYDETTGSLHGTRPTLTQASARESPHPKFIRDFHDMSGNANVLHSVQNQVAKVTRRD
jgi:hypothetical protein